MSKYTANNLIPALRSFTAARRKALDAGFTDNGGAIHSIERIANIYGMRVNYPGMQFPQHLKDHPKAEFSVAAWAAHQNGERVEVEHVNPMRAWCRSICALIEQGNSDKDVHKYVASSYRLVLLTPEERRSLDKRNRSRMCPDRLDGIEIVRPSKIA